MTTSLKNAHPTVSTWHISFSRAWLVPILIFDCVIAYFYYGWRFTDGVQGLPPKYTLALLAVVHSLQVFVLLLEVAVCTCQWVWANISHSARPRAKSQATRACVFLLLCGCAWIWSSYMRASNPYSEGSVHTPGGTAMYKLYHHDQSVHYYMQRKDSRDGIVVKHLCTSDTSQLVEKTYVRCLYRERSVVMGRPPMRAPGKWVTDTLTKQDEEVLEALKKNGVLK